MNIKELTDTVVFWVVTIVVFFLTSAIGGVLMYLFQSSQGNYKDGSWRSWVESLVGFGLSCLVATKIVNALYPNSTVEGTSPSDLHVDNHGATGREVSSASGGAPRGQGLSQGG